MPLKDNVETSAAGLFNRAAHFRKDVEHKGGHRQCGQCERGERGGKGRRSGEHDVGARSSGEGQEHETQTGILKAEEEERQEAEEGEAAESTRAQRKSSGAD